MQAISFSDRLEQRQIPIYFAAVFAGVVLATTARGTQALEVAINPALALMLFVTFLQVPLHDLRNALARTRFIATLMVSNFVAIPVLVVALAQFLPNDAMLRLGVLFVLLTPCIDYVITFSYVGRADSRLLLASTPILLGAQMVLLPIYLRAILGDAASELVQPEPFLHAFAFLIALPFAAAAMVQRWAARSNTGARIADTLGALPVPATAGVLFIVVAAVVPQLGAATQAAIRVLPIYIAFACIAPFIGWALARAAKLDTPAGRALAFSSATRNSLVILPLALAVPGAIPVLPAVIVTQTMVELVASVFYMRLMPKFGQT